MALLGEHPHDAAVARHLVDGVGTRDGKRAEGRAFSTQTFLYHQLPVVFHIPGVQHTQGGYKRHERRLVVSSRGRIKPCFLHPEEMVSSGRNQKKLQELYYSCSLITQICSIYRTEIYCIQMYLTNKAISDNIRLLGMMHMCRHNACFHHNAHMMLWHTLVPYFVISHNGEKSLNKL